jgi:mRNA interferase YafQ
MPAMKMIEWTTAFKKDYKRMIKRGKSDVPIKEVLMNLAKEVTLDEKYLDHPLKGSYAGTRECHIEPDWLLIYLPKEETIVMIRTGTHSDLFK